MEKITAKHTFVYEMTDGQLRNKNECIYIINLNKNKYI